MSTILIGWELGDGLGHVATMLDVANELAARGHRPVLVVKDLAVTRAFLRDVPYPVLQAPIFREQVPPSFRTSSFADILAISGFGDADGLRILVNAWQSLVEMTGARLVVCNFAPSLCLAAYGVLPTVLVGTGFTVPPWTAMSFPGSDRILAQSSRPIRSSRMCKRCNGDAAGRHRDLAGHDGQRGPVRTHDCRDRRLPGDAVRRRRTTQGAGTTHVRGGPRFIFRVLERREPPRGHLVARGRRGRLSRVRLRATRIATPGCRRSQSWYHRA